MTLKRAAFQFFWDQANPQTGLIKDRANAAGNDNYTLSSIASVGFGLTALCIGDSRGYMASATIRDRVLTTLTHAWFDFRNKHDGFADYFQNSVKATQAHKQFCLALAPQYPAYADDLWGITASDSAHGCVVWGGPPVMGPIDGTVVPCAAGGSLPFLYPDCMKVLRNIRGKYAARAWGKYGFIGAFNPASAWTNPDVIGLDVGITMLMAENYRTQFVWNTFMTNPEAQAAMQIAGFQAN